LKNSNRNTSQNTSAVRSSYKETEQSVKKYKPFNALQFGISNERKVIHRQQIMVPMRAKFDVEFSVEGKKFIIIAKRRMQS